MRLIGANGKLLCAEEGGGGVINARTEPDGAGAWEEFTESKQPGGTVSLQSSGGFYVSAQPDGTVEVNRTVLGPWEEWTKRSTTDGIGYLSYHGLFLCTDMNLPVSNPEWSGFRVVADRPVMQSWETFVPHGAGFGKLSALATRGEYFQLETGERFTAIECTDFRLFERYLQGEDVSRVLEQRHDYGFNMVRVLGTCHNMFRLYPQEYANYYEALPPFAQMLAQYGLYMEFTVFADATMAMPNIDDQLRHWTAVGNALRGQPNVIIELVNENNQSVNRIDTNRFQALTGIICSHGSNGSGADPVRPWWQYETYHTNDAFQWWRKVGHNAMEYAHGAKTITASHVPVLTNENTRPDRDGSMTHFHDGAAGAALLVAGSCFHSNSGKNSTLFGVFDGVAAWNWVAGAKSVPIHCQDEPYRRRDDLLKPGILRVYQRGWDNHCIVYIND